MRCKFLFFLSLLIIPHLLMSQEICDNGIDDDADGLIDLNDDTECICDGDLPGSFYVINEICTAYPIFSMATDFQGGQSYQWYRDGIALVDETDLIFLASQPYVAGVYVLNVQTSSGCLSSNPYTLINGSVTTNVTDTICLDETYIFNGNEISVPGNYFAQFTASNGCDSTVQLSLELHDCGDTIRNLSTQFYNQLIAAGVDENGDLKIQYTEAESMDSLDVSYDNSTPSWEYRISDIRGIEYFYNLVYLNCANNSIYSLEIDSLKKLQHLNCYSNNMSNLSLTKLNDLEYVDLGGLNQLKYFRITSGVDLHSIDFSEAINLEKIIIRQAELDSPIDFTPLTKLKELTYTLSGVSEIDLTKASEIEYLDLTSNQLSSFDGSFNPKLYHLNLYDNLDLSSIDLSKNLELVTLDVQRSNLNDHILDLSNNVKLDTLKTHQVKELWIKNGSIERELDLWFDIWYEYVCCDEEQYDEVRAMINQDVPVSFECSLVNVTELNELEILLSPNLASEFIKIQSSKPVSNIETYDSNGQLISKGHYTALKEINLDVSTFQEGLYFLKIETHEGVISKKFIKID